jgi:hypothetical protein
MEYVESPRVVYNGYCYVRICPKCGRFVKADDNVMGRGIDSDWIPARQPNATCKKCGRVEMPAEGFVE